MYTQAIVQAFGVHASRDAFRNGTINFPHFCREITLSLVPEAMGQGE